MYFMWDTWTADDINSRLYFCFAWDNVYVTRVCLVLAYLAFC